MLHKQIPCIQKDGSKKGLLPLLNFNLNDFYSLLDRTNISKSIQSGCNNTSKYNP
jgi:hypothetical protein